MSDPFLGEIKLVSWNLAPGGGRSMYGGDGVTTFALPDLRGMTPVHMGPG
jgi:microcystin-dependent protein